MSDFSAGFFFLSKNKDKIYPYMNQGEVLIQYNETWVGKLSSSDLSTNYQPQDITLSNEVPMLHIIHAEDHGFFLRILHECAVVFEFDISYEVGTELYTEIGNMTCVVALRKLVRKSLRKMLRKSNEQNDFLISVLCHEQEKRCNRL